MNDKKPIDIDDTESNEDWIKEVTRKRETSKNDNKPKEDSDK